MPAKIDPSNFTQIYIQKAKDKKASADEQESARLMVLAEGDMYDEEVAQAMKTAGEALEIFRKMKDAKGCADATRVLCHCNIFQGKRKEANKLAKDEMALCKEAGEVVGEAIMKLCIAEANAERRGEKNRAMAVEVAKEAGATFYSKGDKRMQGHAQIVLANLYVRQKTDAEKSVKAAQQAATEAAGLLSDAGDKRGEGMAMHSMALACIKGLKFAPQIEGLAESCMDSVKAAEQCFKAAGLQKLQAFEMVCWARWTIEVEEKTSKAVSLATKALKFCQSVSSGQEYAAVCVLVEAYIALSKKDSTPAGKSKMSNKAEKTASDAIARFQASGAKSAEGHCWHALAMAQMASGREDQALASADRCVEVFKEVEDEEAEATVLQLVSELASKKTSEADKALAAGEGLKKLSKGVKQQVKAMEAIFNANMLKQDFSQAKATAKNMVEILKDAGAPSQQAFAKQCLCQAHFYAQEFAAAVTVGREVADAFHAMGDIKEEGKIMMTVADIHVAAQEFEHALRAVSKSKALLKQAEAQELEGDASFLMAQVLLTILTNGVGFDDRNFEAFSAKFFDFSDAVKETKFIAKKFEKPVLNASAVCLMAQAYTYIDQVEAALKCTADAAEVFREIEDDVNLAHVMVIEADAWLVGGQKSKAKEVCRAANKIFKEYGDVRGEATAAITMERIDPPKAPEPPKEEKWWDEDYNWWDNEEEDKVAKPAAQAAAKAADIPAGSAYEKKVMTKIDLNNIDEGLLRDKLYDVVQSTVGYVVDDLEDDLPLMQAGIASRQAVTLRAELMEEFDGIQFPATMVFDFPTINSLKDYVMENA